MSDDRDDDDDLELLRRWREGDGDAGNRLFERYSPNLFAFFSSKGPSHAVPDLIQETMTACVEARDRFRGDATFRSFLFGIARNVLFGHYKRQRRDRDRFDPKTITAHDLGPSPSTFVRRRGEQRLLVAALRRIPLDLQIVLELHYWESMTTSELALALDLPPGTVKSRLRRARERLESMMDHLAESGDDVEATLSDLPRWIQSIQVQVADGEEPPDEQDDGGSED